MISCQIAFCQTIQQQLLSRSESIIFAGPNGFLSYLLRVMTDVHCGERMNFGVCFGIQKCLRESDSFPGKWKRHPPSDFSRFSRFCSKSNLVFDEQIIVTSKAAWPSHTQMGSLRFGGGAETAIQGRSRNCDSGAEPKRRFRGGAETAIRGRMPKLRFGGGGAKSRFQGRVPKLRFGGGGAKSSFQGRVPKLRFRGG
jgi:hypothetical protein